MIANRFSASDLPLSGLKLVTRQRLGDHRGFLSRLFCAEELAAAGWSQPIAQINHTYTALRGTVRGMHFQRPPHAEMKLVNCIRGEVWDVAVDVRAGSPTFLRWHAERLSAENGQALLIPEGFAHGFQALTDDVELLYCHSAAYCADAEDGLNPQDARLNIAWPLAITELSARDASRPLLETDFEGIRL
jgi:dTDP-4-dehydrorhamnose 3,5-epimerase